MLLGARPPPAKVYLRTGAWGSIGRFVGLFLGAVHVHVHVHVVGAMWGEVRAPSLDPAATPALTTDNPMAAPG